MRCGPYLRYYNLIEWYDLATARHNELRDGVADLAGEVFTQTQVHDNPLIFAGCTVKRTTANTAISKTTPSTKNIEATEQNGDPLIRDL